METLEFNPALNEITADNFSRKKKGEIKIALHNSKFEALEKNFKAKYSGKVRDFTAEFNLALSFYPECKKTFVLHIEASESEIKHQNSLPLNGFGSCLFRDYALASHAIASQFCSINKLRIVHENSHWPLLQYIVEQV
jgi:hypothetical protein